MLCLASGQEDQEQGLNQSTGYSSSIFGASLQLASLCNCGCLKPHHNLLSLQILPDSRRPDQIRPDKTRPVFYKDLSLPFLKVRSINFVFTNIILVHLQVSGLVIPEALQEWSSNSLLKWIQSALINAGMDPGVWTHTLLSHSYVRTLYWAQLVTQ